MLKLSCGLAFLFLMLPLHLWSQSDTVVVRNFNTSNYKAASFNYTGLQARNGNYYFANENGILQYDGSEWVLHSIKNYSGVLSMVEDADETLYIGSFNEFGYARRDSSGSFTYTSLREQFSADSTINEVWQVVLMGKDVYFQSYERILRWDGKQVHNIPLKNAHIFRVKDHLYASVINGNLLRIQGDTTVFVSDKIKHKEDAAYQILPGPGGKYIIFTSFHGWYLLDDEKQSVEKWNVAVDDFFRKGYLYSCIVWRDSLYVCSTWEKGLAFVNKKGELVKNITKNDGLPANFLREGFQDKRKNLWFGSNYGITYIQWPKLNSGGDAPATIITKVGNDEQVLARPYLHDLEMPYKSAVTFHFATPGFEKSDLEYSFYMEGTDKGWSPWTDDVKKEYTNISGGEHIFHVKGRLQSGMETLPASINFDVPRPWYLSYWFMAAVVLLFVGIVYGIVKVRTIQLKRLNKQLEDIVNSRTYELVEQREQLQNANKDLRTINTELDNFVYRSSHDLVAPLKSLKGLIHLAKLDNPGQTQMHYLQIMNASVLRLEDFIKSIMDYSVNAKREIELKEVKLDSIINDIISEIQYFENAGKVDLKKEYPEDFIIKSDFSRLKIIFSNLITNSVKYHNYDQARPYIKVTAEHNSNGKTCISVTDNGQGIAAEFLPKIFDMFFRASEAAEGSGLGLYIVKDTANKLGAEISVDSEPGKGTMFTLTIG